MGALPKLELPFEEVKMKCVICSRRANERSPFCEYHGVASLNLNKHHADWERAYGSISWERYLESISQLSDSGDWVQEVAKYELNQLQSKETNNISRESKHGYQEKPPEGQ